MLESKNNYYLFSHFILTRFNLETPGKEKTVRSQSGWLKHRMELFEHFCLPSVMRQTNKNFIWLIYADIRTPSEYLNRFQSYSRLPFVSLQFVDGLTHSLSIVKADIQRLAPSEAKWLITTRLDNDDILSKDFIENVQKTAVFDKRRVINFRRGLLFADGKVYLHFDASNTFTSMVESIENPLTIWCRQHTDLRYAAPILQVNTCPMWCQVVHQRNVSNRINGIRLHLDSAENFGLSHKDFKSCSIWSVWAENICYFPIRWVNYVARKIIRYILHSVKIDFIIASVKNLRE